MLQNPILHFADFRNAISFAAGKLALNAAIPSTRESVGRKTVEGSENCQTVCKKLLSDFPLALLLFLSKANRSVWPSSTIAT